MHAKPDLEPEKRRRRRRRRSKTPALTPLQLDVILRHERAQIAVRHAIDGIVHDAIRGMGIAISKEAALARLLEEFASPGRAMQRIVATHVPSEHAQLRETARVDAGGVDGHVDGLTVVAVCVAGVGAVEEEFAGGVV